MHIITIKQDTVLQLQFTSDFLCMTSHWNTTFVFLSSFSFLFFFSIECWVTKPFSYLSFFPSFVSAFKKKVFLSRDYVDERCNNSTDEIKIIELAIIFQGMRLYSSSLLSVQEGEPDRLCVRCE